VAWPHDAFRPVASAQRDAPFRFLVIISACNEFMAGPEVQLHRLDIGFEPIGELVLRDVDGKRWRERQMGQVVDVHFIVQRQRMIARAPVVADAFVPIDDQRVDAKLMKARRNRKSGLPATDDEHGGVTFRKGALFLQTIGPVLRAEVACRIGLATPF
jgi:hypothetical protein